MSESLYAASAAVPISDAAISEDHFVADVPSTSIRVLNLLAMASEIVSLPHKARKRKGHPLALFAEMS